MAFNSVTVPDEYPDNPQWAAMWNSKCPTCGKMSLFCLSSSNKFSLCRNPELDRVGAVKPPTRPALREKFIYEDGEIVRRETVNEQGYIVEADLASV